MELAVGLAGTCIGIFLMGLSLAHIDLVGKTAGAWLIRVFARVGIDGWREPQRSIVGYGLVAIQAAITFVVVFVPGASVVALSRLISGLSRVPREYVAMLWAAAIVGVVVGRVWRRLAGR